MGNKQDDRKPMNPVHKKLKLNPLYSLGVRVFNYESIPPVTKMVQRIRIQGVIRFLPCIGDELKARK